MKLILHFWGHNGLHQTAEASSNYFFYHPESFGRTLCLRNKSHQISKNTRFSWVHLLVLRRHLLRFPLYFRTMHAHASLWTLWSLQILQAILHQMCSSGWAAVITGCSFLCLWVCSQSGSVKSVKLLILLLFLYETKTTVWRRHCNYFCRG